MTKNEYNGWYNYETWVVALWMDNDAGSQEFWSEVAQDVWDAEKAEGDFETRKENAIRSLEDLLKERHEELLPELEGFAADLLGAAMSEVNWREIAKNKLEEIAQEAAEEKE